MATTIKRIRKDPSVMKRLQKQEKRVMVETESPYNFDGKIVDIIKGLENIIARHGPDATIDYSSSGYSQYCDSPEFGIFIRRLETDEEFEERKLKLAGEQAAQDQRDIDEFNRLKTKLGLK